MKIKFILPLFFLPIFALGQYTGLSYHRISFKLDSLLSIAKDTPQYLNALQKIPIDVLLESDVFTSIKIFAIKKQFDKVVEYADQSMLLGQDAETIFQFSGDLIPPDIKLKLSKNECALHNQYQKKVPKTLTTQISDMALVDSKLRELGILKKVSYTAIRFNDSINFNNLKSIIGKYGMITERKEGSLFNKFYYILIHCSYYHDSDYQFMKKLFYASVLKGDNKPDLYAYFVDRRESEVNKGQMYGSFANPYEGIGVINDIKDIDYRRSLIGACTFRNWLLLRHVDLKYLPEGYKN